ncbi:MAG: thioredoxin domain-containing protein [Acidobacteriota bacterium]
MKLSTLFATAFVTAGVLTAPIFADDEVAAKVGDKVITRAELNEKAASSLAQVRAQEYKVLKDTLDQMINDQLVAEAAKKAGKTPEEYEKDRIDSKLTEPTDAEISAFYEQVKARAGGQTLEQLKPRLVENLKQQQGAKLYGDMISELRKAASVAVLLDPPRATVSVDNDPGQGPADAPITMIAFSDYQCPFCKRVEPTVHDVLAKYPGKIRYVFRDYPLSFHQFAQKAGEAAGCADEQGKFWEMHEKLFANNTALAVDNLKQYAKDLGLNADQFNQCLDGGKRAQEVSEDFNAGNLAGVSGTPAFFINGRFINGAVPLENFTEVIDEELARADAKKSIPATGKKDAKKKG